MIALGVWEYLGTYLTSPHLTLLYLPSSPTCLPYQTHLYQPRNWRWGPPRSDPGLGHGISHTVHTCDLRGAPLSLQAPKVPRRLPSGTTVLCLDHGPKMQVPRPGSSNRRQAYLTSPQAHAASLRLSSTLPCQRPPTVPWRIFVLLRPRHCQLQPPFATTTLAYFTDACGSLCSRISPLPGYACPAADLHQRSRTIGLCPPRIGEPPAVREYHDAEAVPKPHPEELKKVWGLYQSYQCLGHEGMKRASRSLLSHVTWAYVFVQFSSPTR